MYQSPFTRLNLTEEGIDKISKVQQLFDGLYRDAHRAANLSQCRELLNALNAMQEASFWYSRAISIQHSKDKPFVPREKKR